MKVLVIKTSSLGDVLHTLPALSDAMRALPGIRFDWVVEEAFAEIPAWHSAVDRVIPVAWRRWRRAPIKTLRTGEWTRFWSLLRAEKYDKIIDAQGLLKSALLTCMARGERCGPDFSSARESWSALAYQQRYTILEQQHAIARMRQLFAAALGYAIPQDTPEYGINKRQFVQHTAREKYVLFLHGTNWTSKQWPESYWIMLAELANQAGFTVCLPWGSSSELQRAQHIASASKKSEVLPKMNLSEVASVLCHASAVVAVDTGLAHLAAALSVPCVTLYGATKPELTGTLGENQHHLCAEFICAPCLRRTCNYTKATEIKPACYQSIAPARVWHHATLLMRSTTAVTQ